jgi:hypothetical protein
MENKINSKALESIANGDMLPINDVEARIITIRGVQVILDKDLAGFYGVETKALNQAVKRNLERFPEYYRW